MSIRVNVVSPKQLQSHLVDISPEPRRWWAHWLRNSHAAPPHPRLWALVQQPQSTSGQLLSSCHSPPGHRREKIEKRGQTHFRKRSLVTKVRGEIFIIFHALCLKLSIYWSHSAFPSLNLLQFFYILHSLCHQKKPKHCGSKSLSGIMTSIMQNVQKKRLSYHLYAAVFLKCGGEVSHHLLGQDLHCLVLQLVFPDIVLTG